MDKSDFAKRLANKLIEQLKAGTAPWQQPTVTPPQRATADQPPESPERLPPQWRSSRARQTPVVVLDVMLNRGPAVTPDKKVAFPLGQRDAYEGWLITPPYITRITMVRTKSWL